MNNKEINSNISLVYHDIENTYSDSKSILADIMKHANDNFEEIENIYRLVAMISFTKIITVREAAKYYSKNSPKYSGI